MSKSKEKKAEEEAKKKAEAKKTEVVETKVEEEEVNLDDVILEDNTEETETKDDAPVITSPDKGAKGKKMERVKFIKDMPPLFIIGNYYEAKKDETHMLPVSVAYRVRGNGGKSEQFAV